MRVAYWKASDDGSSWYRAEQPAAELRRRGHDVWCSRVLPPSRHNSDVIIGSRVAGEQASQTWARLAQTSDVKLILDLDDDYFHVPTDNPSFEDWRGGGPAWTRLCSNARMADRVTTCSQYLAHEVFKVTAHPDIRVVPNGLDAGWLGTERSYEHRQVDIGWSGSAGTFSDIHLAARALNRILDYRPATGRGAQPPILHLIGATREMANTADLTHPRVWTREWAFGNDRYMRTVMGFDIWVAPYRDHPYNRAKFATKALEAAFLGIPLIVSDIHPYRAWVKWHSGPVTTRERAEQCGVWLVSEPHEWGRALKTLVDSPELRRTMGTAARSVAGNYILQGPIGDAWERACTEWD